MHRLLFLLALALPSATQAQTTHCEPAIIGMPSAGVDCTTRQPATSGPPAPHISWKDVPPRACSKMEKLANGSNYLCEAREVAATRKAVGDLVAAGQCDEAIKAALGTGDFGFASEVRVFCSSALK